MGIVGLDEPTMQQQLFDNLNPMPAQASEWRYKPVQSHSPTSIEAAESIEPNIETLRAVVLDYIRKCGSTGATDEEAQDAIPMPANTQRPRRRELQLAGFIRDSGQTRETKSGRKAVVWIAI